MKITDDKNQQETFDNLERNDVFRYNGKLYLKVGNNLDSANVFNLREGYLGNFEGPTLVQPVYAELVIS